MKLSKKLFTAGIVAALTLSVAASALAAELTVKTKKNQRRPGENSHTGHHRI